MTITTITGTPGAGKTLHAIEKLLLPLVGTTVEQMENGVMVSHPRTIYTNIKGLTIEHELIGQGGDWTQDKTGEWTFKGTGQGLRDWHLWAKPGAVIVYDEVQQVWKPRANGSPVPPDIGMLETHRHMGVDLVLITQNVMLVDRNIQALMARHLHVRRMANLNLAIVYEWDHCSKSLMYSKALTKTPWRYDKKIFKLYHSSDLHTKQPRSMPGLVWFILLGLVAAAILGPTMYKRMQDRFTPPSLAVPAAASKSSSQPGQALQNAGAALPASAASGQTVPGQASQVVGMVGPVQAVPVFAGCARLRNVCQCYDSAAQIVDKPSEFCSAQTVRHPAIAGLPAFMDKVPDMMPDQRYDVADLALAGWVNRKNHPPPGALYVKTELGSVRDIR